MRIGLASPDKIREWSYGEVKKPETINYRTLKPERDGLFCERIFGPTHDWECHCGKYKRIRYKGVVCDRCGVEVTRAKVRRERMGHIELAAPVSHIWYFKGIPSRMGLILNISPRSLEKVLYFASYIVLDPGDTPLIKKQLLTESEYRDNRAKYGESFRVGMGAEAVKELLVELDLDKMNEELRKDLREVSGQRKIRAIRRLEVVEAFRKSGNQPSWMILDAVPVIPPELRPMVQLDGGRFATSDLNDLYRRVINRNNRLKRLLDLGAPDIIVRNEKRMLQEAVDALIDNGRRGRPVTGPGNRPLKSLSDMLKGKQGRFRQNLLGKRVDYSARSVIVVGPELKMGECGLPKEMAAELYKPFIIRKLIERGIVKTVKSAKKFIDRKDPVVYDILENVMKGHPVLLNRAPTLHRLGIQAFQPKMIEGRAIQLHPLACTAFNADFDGDQMAVHLPLGNEAILEAQLLMLGSHNILNPANGAPITIPSQDMVLGLYYITKELPGAKGEGMTFASPEEAEIALNEGKVDIHARINVRLRETDSEGNSVFNMIKDTTVGRVIVNKYRPKEVSYINELFTKKSLRDIIGNVIENAGVAKTAQFLDDIKNLGYQMAFKGGLSFNLFDVIIPDEKSDLVKAGYEEVDKIVGDYNMGFITNNERYNQIIDVWTRVNKQLTDVLMKKFVSDKQGFNSVYMMLDSGARGSKEQIRQLSGMRGLMAKPQKAGAEGGQIIENPILANFKEGLSVLEYFISTHGARKGLADTALKTADAGYLTRRLVDVSHDVIITAEDCGTLRGLTVTELKNKEEVISTLGERILGRVTVHDVRNPKTNEIIVPAGEIIDEKIAAEIERASIERVEVRSVLTCEQRLGVCAKCYGRNLSNGLLVNKGEAVGVIAAQSIGEPGTQLTLRTFHVGGIASNIAAESKIVSRYDGILEIDEIRTVDTVDATGKDYQVVVSRQTEMRIIDPNTKIAMTIQSIPYGAKLYFKSGSEVKKGDLICDWDPFNAVIISEVAGKIDFDSVIENVTYKTESDEATGLREKIIIESKDKTKTPSVQILDKGKNIVKSYNLPVSAHLVVDSGQEIKAGDILVKIPRAQGKAGDITGGLPRVTELFEARNPSNPAIVAEIDGEVSFGKIKRGNREISVTSKTGEEKKYLVPLSKQILVQEGDFVRAGIPLSDGVITPADILAIKGPTAVQEYIVNEIQDVYRLQGVKINDKHFEIIVRQMMSKVQINEPGDTHFLEGQLVDKHIFMEENDKIWGTKVVLDAGDSTNFQPGQMVTARRLREENSSLKRKDLKLVETRDAVAATSSPVLQGITRAALHTRSFMSAASFQETTKVLNEAAISGRVDKLEGMKENVIVGNRIPAGTGLREYDKIVVMSKEEYDRIHDTSLIVTDYGDLEAISYKD